MAASRFKIRLRGDFADQEHLRLSDFIGQLSSLSSLLTTIDKSLTRSEHPSTYYRLVELRHESPVTLAVEAVSLGPVRDITERIVTQLFDGLSYIARQNIPDDFDREVLEGYKNLAGGLRRHVREIVFARNGQEHSLTPAVATIVDSLLGPDETCEGTISGMLEMISVHGVPQFTIYPPVGPRKISCRIPAESVAAALSGFGRYVSVTGTLRYRRRAPFPYAVDIAAMEVLPPAEELPSLFKLRGIAPDATRGLPSEEFIRRLRDAAA